jgi:hypothetical protein
MPDKHAYPEQEHLRQPTNPIHVIEDELHYYPNPAEFCSNLGQLTKIYRSIPLLQSCSRYATLLSVSPVGNESMPSKKPRLNQAFFAGEVLGIHALYNSLPWQKRNTYARFDPLEEYNWGDDDEDPKNIHLHEELKTVSEFRESGWREIFAESNSHSQNVISEAAILIHAGMNDKSSPEETIIAGMLFSSGLLHQALEEGNGRYY